MSKHHTSSRASQGRNGESLDHKRGTRATSMDAVRPNADMDQHANAREQASRQARSGAPSWYRMGTEDASLSQHLHCLHGRLLETIPVVDRVACVIYDPKDDLLKTFVNSTRHGQAITAYEARLADSASLTRLARDRELRVVDDIPATIEPSNTHSRWLLEQGYHSSFTVPMYDGAAFLGFVFLDSVKRHAFDKTIQAELILFCSLVNSVVARDIATIRTMSASVNVARDFANLRDFETGGHLERMSRYARLIARSIAPHFGLTDEFIEYLYLFAPLHDIGKIGIPDSVLLKPSKLDTDERQVMQSHVEKGHQVIERILGDFQLQTLPSAQILRNIIRYHHEMMDGSGYPYGLSGEQIPIEARIVTVADIFDALLSKRPYKEQWSKHDVGVELTRMVSEGKLDPHCVDAILSHADEALDIGVRFCD